MQMFDRLRPSVCIPAWPSYPHNGRFLRTVQSYDSGILFMLAAAGCSVGSCIPADTTGRGLAQLYCCCDPGRGLATGMSSGV